MATNPEVNESKAKSEHEAFIQAANVGLAKGLHKITHCMLQLTDEQVWQRPRPEMNSVGNLITHLCGNLRQWIISGVGGSPDVRNRPAEFAALTGPTRDQL